MWVPTTVTTWMVLLLVVIHAQDPLQDPQLDVENDLEEPGGLGGEMTSEDVGSDPSNSGSRQYGGTNRGYGGRRQHGGGGGGERRQGGGGERRQGGGGGRVRQQYPSLTHRQYGGRQSVGRGGGGGGGGGGGNNDDNMGEVTGFEMTPRQTDAIILLMQRLSERLTGMEMLQRQQAERIDTINYRLTRIELQAEERKGVITELSNSVRHRMGTSDEQLDRITSQLELINSGITSMTQRQTDIQNTVNQIPKEKDEGGSSSGGPKLQAVIATIHNLRTTTQGVRQDLNRLTQNLTMLNNITKNLDQISETMVSKQYLQQNLNELQSPDASLTLLAQTMMAGTRTSRRRGGGGPNRQQEREAEDCWELQQRGVSQSGVYTIQPKYSTTPFMVYCDMETDGGGWTVIQRREDGTIDFLREWHDYKHGFGNLAGEFWLGNERLHQLTNLHVSKLRVDLADFDQQVGHALYSAFAVGSELEGYSLKMLGLYSGDAGDSLRYHVGRRFSTSDVDNDAWPDKSCARDHQGAWWYRACETSNLNGRYLHGPLPVQHQYTGLYWYDFRGPQYSLWRSSMMVRRGGVVSQPVFKNLTEITTTTTTTTTNRPADDDTGETSTSTDQENFNPDYDPYATYQYPFY